MSQDDRMSNIEHYAPEDDVPDDWRPFDQRKWSREELLAEIDALNECVAKWVGIATQRKGAVTDLAAAVRLLNDAQTTIIDTDLRREWEAERARLRALVGGQ